MRPWIQLPPKLIERCHDYGRRVVASYQVRKRNSPYTVSTHNAEDNALLQAEGKMAECVFAIEYKFDVERDVTWGDDPDIGYDFVLNGWLIDVKSTKPRGRYLLWPIGKTTIFDRIEFDVLVLTKADIDAGGGYSSHWITKKGFRRKRLIAEPGHKLTAGTRYVDQDQMEPIETLLEQSLLAAGDFRGLARIAIDQKRQFEFVSGQWPIPNA